jgi:thiol-disulfide isomerase/thioredoxin
MNLIWKFTLLMAVVIVSTLAVPAIGQPERGIEVGQGIEPRELRTIEREKIQFPTSDELTVVVFWATWSPRSAPALELWQKYGQQYAENGVRVITVNADHQDMGQEDEVKIRNYLAEHDLSLPVIVDAQLELFNEIGVIVLPTTFFFKPDGTMDYKYPGLPTSADLDLKEELEAKLGIAKEITEEEDTNRGKLAYQPKNNALLFFNMGRMLNKKGFPDKAKAKYLEALQKDPDYEDPLRGLEDVFFAQGRTPETEERLKVLLTANGLEGVIEKISAVEIPPTDASAPAEPDPAGQDSAPAGTKDKPLTPMEKMRLLMEGKQ